MKIYLKLPNRGEFQFEKEPMSEERFNLLCVIFGVLAFLIFCVKIATILFR